MPLTASNTADETRATWRLVTSGLVPVARTVSFVIFIHSSTGSGAAAETGNGCATTSAAIRNNGTGSHARRIGRGIDCTMGSPCARYLRSEPAGLSAGAQEGSSDIGDLGDDARHLLSRHTPCQRLSGCPRKTNASTTKDMKAQ